MIISFATTHVDYRRLCVWEIEREITVRGKKFDSIS